MVLVRTVLWRLGAVASPATVLLPRARAIGTATALIARRAARASAVRLRGGPARRPPLGNRVHRWSSVRSVATVRRRRGRSAWPSASGTVPEVPDASARAGRRARSPGRRCRSRSGGCFVLIAGALALGRDRRRGDRQGPRPARRRPGGDLGGALDARRPAATALAAAPAERRCPTRPTSPRRPTWSGRATPRSPPARAQRSRSRAACGSPSPTRASFAPVRAKATVVGKLDLGAGGGAARSKRAPKPKRRRRCERRRRRPGDRERRRLQRPARLPRRRGDEARRRGRLRPDGGRRAAAGITLIVVSGFRSDAEQAELFAAHPDPKWVAPPGTLAAPLRDRARPRPRIRLRLDRRQRRAASASSSATAGRPGTTGFDRRPAALLGRPATRSAGRARTRARRGGATLPSFVPARFRDPLIASAAKWNVSRGAARRAADGGEQLQPLRRLARRGRRASPSSCPAPRPPTACGPLRPGRSDRRPGPPDVGPDPPVRLPRARPRRLQRRPGPGRSLPLRPRHPRDAAPTSPASWPSSAAPAPSPSPRFEVRLVA